MLGTCDGHIGNLLGRCGCTLRMTCKVTLKVTHKIASKVTNKVICKVACTITHYHMQHLLYTCKKY